MWHINPVLPFLNNLISNYESLTPFSFTFSFKKQLHKRLHKVSLVVDLMHATSQAVIILSCRSG